MLKKILITNLFFLLLSFTASIAKDLSCETFSGEWNGNKKGAGYKGDLKIVFDDGCKYDIFKKNGKILTPGKIKIKKGVLILLKKELSFWNFHRVSMILKSNNFQIKKNQNQKHIQNKKNIS